MTHTRNQPEERLSAALRELAESSSQGASPELGLVLKDAFRRHHHRRKRMQRIGIGIVCISLAGLAAVLWPRKTQTPTQSPLKPQETVVHAILPQQPSRPANVQAPGGRRHVSPRKTSSPRPSPAAAEAFVALPALAMRPADDELRVVRLEMSGEDLRLVGAPVTEKIARHRVTADFVVGPDGTPYAVRLVQSKY
jgi:hypothetical protein